MKVLKKVCCCYGDGESLCGDTSSENTIFHGLSNCPECRKLSKQLNNNYYNTNCPFYDDCVTGEDESYGGGCRDCVHNLEEVDE